MTKFIRWFSAPKLLVFAVLAGGIAVVVARWNTSLPQPIDVAEPRQLSSLARQGKVLFEANCADCHGERAGGSDKGPPLVHVIYRPGHHADASFVLAAANGVRAHHWPFGNMPPQPQVTETEVGAITRYVRELQRANGIGGT
jgi:mono/diheme cytochrome c family protein